MGKIAAICAAFVGWLASDWLASAVFTVITVALASIGVGIWEFDGWLSHPLIPPASFGLAGIIFVALAWSGFKRRKPMAGHFTARDSIRHMWASSAWGWRELWKLKFQEIVALQAPTEFRRAAEQGEVNVTGRTIYSSVVVTIPPSYWQTARLRESSVIGLGNSPGETEPDGLVQNFVQYTDLRVSKAEVMQTWPKVGLLHRSLIHAAICWGKKRAGLRCDLTLS